jgi:hypothetical protein
MFLLESFFGFDGKLVFGRSWPASQDKITKIIWYRRQTGVDWLVSLLG